MHGFQLWANLPASLKMTDPRYQDVIATDIPEVTDDDGTRVRVICGDFWGQRGPVDGIAAEPSYVDISVRSGPTQDPEGRDDASRVCVRLRGLGNVPERLGTTRRGHRAGRRIDACSAVDDVANRSLVLFDRGDEITVQAGDHGIRFLLVSGQAARRARRLVRSDRHEHEGRTAAGDGRDAGGDVHQKGQVGRVGQVGAGGPG